MDTASRRGPPRSGSSRNSTSPGSHCRAQGSASVPTRCTRPSSQCRARSHHLMPGSGRLATCKVNV
eukprot:8989499-Pyramimonas_sp.AAC.1